MGSNTMGAVSTGEPEDYNLNTATTDMTPRDDGTEVVEAMLDRWDQERWADNIVRQ